MDLGGATGHLALAAKDRYPGLQVTLFDLPEVIEFAKDRFRRIDLDLVAGDFFSDPLPAADLYAVGRILHDWSEDKIRRLLARIYTALPNGGGLLIAERLIDEDRRGPVGDAHAVAEHAGVYGRPRAHARRIYGVAAGSWIRSRAGSGDKGTAGCGAG